MFNNASFAPLTAQEKSVNAISVIPAKDEGVVIAPVPDDAPQEIPDHWLRIPAHVWPYHNADGKLLMKICRFDKPRKNSNKPDKDCLPLTYRKFKDGSQSWAWKGLDDPRPLYGLDRLAARPDAPIIICEGEKATDAATMLLPDFVAVTSPSGARAADKADWTPLAGRDVTIWPDHDDQGQRYAQDVARLAKKAGAKSVYIITVPDDFCDKWDLADDLPDGITNDDLCRLLDEAKPAHTGNGAALATDDDADDLAEIQSVAERMAQLDEAVIDKRLGAEAKALGVGKRTLRKEIGKARLRLEDEQLEQGDQQETSEDPRGRTDLEVIASDLPDTAAALANLLAVQPHLFDRGGPSRLTFDAQRGGLVAELLTVNGVVNECHEIARPFQLRKTQEGSLVRQNVTLSERVARLYLDRKGGGKLRPLDGIALAPLLAEDGSIRTVDGYDAATKLWCERMPDVHVPENPTRQDAERSLLLLRKTFRTFAFADAIKVYEKPLNLQVVDLESPPGEDESAALAAILTGVCRPSLWLAPAIVARAPSISGSGTGKGLIARGFSALSFGTKPQALTAGGTPEEFDKRISAALIGAAETLFLDNINGQTLKSDVLASALTERPCQVRPLGRSVMVPLNVSTLVLITGNGLTLSEDMARRCIITELDACLEDPEQRPFKNDFIEDVLRQRGDLLRAVLTIWRWGRQNENGLTKGKPFGSFSQWCRWVRDPLLTLGCRDPAERIAATKANDPRRRAIAEIFNTWWTAHKDKPTTVAGLHDTVKAVADPQNRGRQYLVSRITSGQLNFAALSEVIE